jgi:hypothetical protein
MQRIFQFAWLFLGVFVLTACSFQLVRKSESLSGMKTPFIPPTLESKTSPVPLTPTTTLEETSPAITSLLTATLPCTNILSYIEDETIPDGTEVTPNSPLDKRWKVKNSGSCNWDDSYRLNLIGGDTLGTSTEQALFPARAGSEIIIQLEFTAPAEPGTYSSSWQAYGPDGNPFGDMVYIEIVVK